MIAIFAGFIEDIMEIFMDNFSLCRSSFDNFLVNLENVLERRVKVNLVLNWEKFQCMVKEGIILKHSIFSRGIDIGRAKIRVMKNLQPSKFVREVQSFLEHASFYRWFIKDFSKTNKLLTGFLMMDVEFIFDECWHVSFQLLKSIVISELIMQPLDWSKPCEIICDTYDYVVGTVLARHKDKNFHAMYYDSKTMYETQINYHTIEKELLAIVFTTENFCSYQVGLKIIIYTDHTYL